MKTARLFALVGLLLAATASAQVNDEIYGALQFDFSTPGARSLGMGKAFVGRADDATASYANPAGLLWLQDPEVAVEGRYRSYDNDFLNGGRMTGTPSGNGIDIYPDPLFSDVETSTSGLSYGSFVYPSDRWAIAVFRHQLGDLEARIRWSQGAFIDNSGNDFRVVPLDAALEMKIAGTGVTGAFKATDNFWLGAGLTYYQLDLSAYSNRYNAIWDFSQPNPWVLNYGLADFSDSNIVDHHSQSSDDSTWAVSLGGLWQQDRWSVGGVYRQGPDFSMDYQYVSGAVGQTANDFFGIDTAGLDAALTGVTQFNVPDVYGLGASYRPSEFSLISVELDWITYSDLAPSDNILINLVNFFDPTFPMDAEELARFVVDDGLEIHLGGEYVFWSKVPLAVRAGLWYDPDHRMRYEGDDIVLQPRFRAGEDILHYTAGLGLVFPQINLQVDGAADFSDAGKVGSLSAVFSW